MKIDYARYNDLSTIVLGILICLQSIFFCMENMLLAITGAVLIFALGVYVTKIKRKVIKDEMADANLRSAEIWAAETLGMAALILALVIETAQDFGMEIHFENYIYEIILFGFGLYNLMMGLRMKKLEAI